MSKAPWCIDGSLKPGDLVKLTAYPSQYEKIGDMGIVEKDTTGPRQQHQIVLVRFTNGQSARKAHFCLEVISEGG